MSRLPRLRRRRVKREISRYGGNGTCAEVDQKERAPEVVAVLLSNASYKAVVEFGSVSSRVLWVKMSIVVMHDPTKQTALLENKNNLLY